MNTAAASSSARSRVSHEKSVNASPARSGHSVSHLAMVQLTRRVLLQSRVSPQEWAAKEAILLSMCEHLLSSSMAPTVSLDHGNSAQVLELCQKRLATQDPSLQSAVRFSALATAFLSSNTGSQTYGSVAVSGGERFVRKVPLLYFLLRAAEKNNAQALGRDSRGRSLFDLVKRPEETLKTNVADINTRIHSALSARTVEAPATHGHATAHEGSLNKSAWEQFEAIQKRDYGGGEEMLLRDLIYVLQGLEGTVMHFSPSTGTYGVSDRLAVARPIRSLVERLGAIGADFRFLQGQVSVHRESNGILRQSFCRAIAQELSEYLKLVAFLETAVNGTSAEADCESVSLKKTIFWFHEAGLMLAFLRELVTETAALRGGALLSLLEQFRQHGNVRIRQMVVRVLDQMMLPFGEMLQDWLQEGSLFDPFGEFFIAENGSVGTARGTSDDHATSSSLDGAEFWHHKFVLRPAELPKFISEALAKRALLAGKTRKFIQAFVRNPPTHLRYSGLGDQTHEARREETKVTTLPETPATADQDNSADRPSTDTDGRIVSRETLLDRLEGDMTAAYHMACRQVRRILLDDCQLLDQLAVIRKYVLFGKGDFSMNLMDLLWDGLNRPAGSLFRHNLVGILEASVRATQSSEPDWILANLDVRLLQPSSSPAEASALVGWDVFALDYRVAFPVDCILDAASLQEYARLSRHIWSLKRLEFVLARCWQQQRTALATASRVNRHELRGDMRRMELLQYEMSSFVRQALSLVFETIAVEWDVLDVALHRISTTAAGVDLDELIRVHRAFLVTLKGKLRLWGTSAARAKMAALSASILRFDAVQGSLLHFLAMCEERDVRQRNAHEYRRMSSLEDEDRFTHFLANQTKLLTELRAAFQSSARHFQADLDDLLMTLQREAGGATAPDALLLLNRLDYNEYHRRRNGFDTRKYM